VDYEGRRRYRDIERDRYRDMRRENWRSKQCERIADAAECTRCMGPLIHEPLVTIL